MTVVTYNVGETRSYSSDDTLILQEGDTLFISDFGYDADNRYALYKAGASLNYPEGTYPSTYQSASYWDYIGNEGGFSDILYSKVAMELPVGTYTFVKAYTSQSSGTGYRGGTLTVYVVNTVYTVSGENYNTDDTITVQLGDTFAINTSNGDISEFYGLYKAGSSLSYPEGTYPSEYQASSYWNVISNEGGLTDILYSKSTMSLPAGTYTFTKALTHLAAGLSTKGKTLTVTVTAPTYYYRPLSYTDAKIQVDSAIRDEDGVRIKTNYAKKSEIPVVNYPVTSVNTATGAVVLGGANIAITGYSKPSSTSALAVTDTINAALGKLEKGLDGKQASGTYVTSNVARNITVSSSAPTGGSDGDIWIQY